VDAEALEGLASGLGLVLLAHRRPHVGVHGVGALGRLVRAGGDHRRLGEAVGGEPVEVLVGGPVAVGAGDAQPHAGGRRAQAEAAGDVVVVPHPAHGAPGEVAPSLPHREQVGDRLARVAEVGEEVDDRHGGGRSPRLEVAVAVDAPGDGGVVAGQHPGDVGERLAAVRADLLGPEGHRVAAELDDGRLAGVPRAQRLLLEVEAHGAAAQAVGVHGGGGEVEDPPQLGGGEVVDLEEVAGCGHARAFPMSSTAWSSSSSVMSSEGARRRAVGVTALATAPSSSRRVTTALASWPSSSTPSRSPRPRTADTPGMSARAARSRFPARVARAGTSSASITASTARAAAVASGWPPKVVAWSPGSKAAATSRLAQQAPIGTPLPRALAIVTTSGTTPSAWWANQRPQRPRPDWTSSTIMRIPRSSQRRRTPRK